ncbi:MAG: T9SS type A sorting domain-containing protein [Candidatus Krumholzibacteriota bacterium]|nr:T9SS type A sorting domain-containing protein [Candidatus Krumholzibacteriota bacterium]
MKIGLSIIVTAILATVSCSDEILTPKKYGAVEGRVAVLSLERGLDHSPGDTLALAELDGVPVYADGKGNPVYTSRGAYALSRIEYGKHVIVSQIIPGVEIRTAPFTLDSEHMILADTAFFHPQYDHHPEAIEILYSYPNPFEYSNRLSYRVRRAIASDVYIYDETGKEVKYVWHTENTEIIDLQWDKRDNDNQVCPPGLYFWVVYGEGEVYSYFAVVME